MGEREADQRWGYDVSLCITPNGGIRPGTERTGMTSENGTS
jgi:hypothetical protein